MNKGCNSISMLLKQQQCGCGSRQALHHKKLRPSGSHEHRMNLLKQHLGNASAQFNVLLITQTCL